MWHQKSFVVVLTHCTFILLFKKGTFHYRMKCIERGMENTYNTYNYVYICMYVCMCIYIYI